MKQFLLKKIKDITREDIDIRYLNSLRAARINHVFELIFWNERLIPLRNFSKEGLKQLNIFYEKNGFSFEILNNFLMSYFETISDTCIKDIPELQKSLAFRNLIKELKNPNLKYEKADEFGKKFIYSFYGQKMVEKLQQVGIFLPNEKLSYFYKPNQDFPNMEINCNFRNKTENYKIPLEDFQKRIEKFFVKELIKELKKPG